MTEQLPHGVHHKRVQHHLHRVKEAHAALDAQHRAAADAAAAERARLLAQRDIQEQPE